MATEKKLPKTGQPVDPTTKSQRSKTGAQKTEQWTAGRLIRDDAEAGQEPRSDTGTYQASQWVGEGQGAEDQANDQSSSWTSGEVIGEQANKVQAPRKDTGEYKASQWVGEGQDNTTAPHTPKNIPPKT